MSKELMRKALIETINEHSPIKGVDLVLRAQQTPVDDNTLYDKDPTWSDVLDELVAEGEIVEINYTLPSMNYREKSIYFPKGTEIELQMNAEEASRN